ncbi:MAG: BON domain-containing protein [Deltaproteobacteria bacterium]|nr:BON domain-containing protein [Deltaproteobacteria bacterium]
MGAVDTASYREKGVFVRAGRFAVFVCLLALLAGCATPGGRSVGEVIDDAAITSKINALIIEDKELKFFKIDVDTFSGGVTLHGAVSSAEAERKIIGLAKGVRGVKEVTSKLTVEPQK